MSDVPRVTVLIPARNEEADIERCLRAVLAQDHPHDRMEIILVDGGSTDSTVEVATAVLSAGDVRWKVIDNPLGTTPTNLNAGLAVASGEILCRVDARSVVPAEYVRLCSEVLGRRHDVVVTGGAQVAIAVVNSPLSVGIARALNNRYAMGGSRYRSGASSGPSDTVYLGAFRTDQLRAAGGWDNLFATNQDYELNRRMGRQGVVWFDERLQVGYVPRQSLRALWKQYYRFGRWKVRYWRFTGEPPRGRQVVLLLAPVVLFGASVPAITCRRRGALMAIGVSIATALEVLGADHPAGTPRSHVLGAVSMGAVTMGWLSGVVCEAFARPT